MMNRPNLYQENGNLDISKVYEYIASLEMALDNASMEMRTIQYKINENGDWDKYFDEDSDLFSKEQWFQYFMIGGDDIEYEYELTENDYKEWCMSYEHELNEKLEMALDNACDMLETFDWAYKESLTREPKDFEQWKEWCFKDE